jgi:hypothetical protein
MNFEGLEIVTNDEICKKVYHNVRNSLYCYVHDMIDDSVKYTVNDIIRDIVYDTICDSIEDCVYYKLKDYEF